MKKIILLVFCALFILVVLAGALMWYFIGQPLYRPGQVAAGGELRSPLIPGEQKDDPDFWQVAPDVKLFHFARGTGRNVLFVHGGPGYPVHSPISGMAGLEDRFRVHYYHQRGCGKSSRPVTSFTDKNIYKNIQQLNSVYGLAAQIADIERIRRILGDDQLVLVGHSFGGFIATLYAIEFPRNVAALVLVSPANTLVMPPEEGGLFEKIENHLPENKRQEFNDFLAEYLNFNTIFTKTDTELAALNTNMGDFYLSAAREKGLFIPEGFVAEDNGGWMVYGMYFSMGKKHDYSDSVKNISAPALVLHGENDFQSDLVGKKYASLIPNAEFKKIPKAGHFSFYEFPDEFSRELNEFLGKSLNMESTGVPEKNEAPGNKAAEPK